MPSQQVHAKVSQPGADRASRTAADDDIDQAVADAHERARELVEHTDDFLDEVDAVLEENVLEILQAFVQRGGQAVAVFLDTVARGFEAVRWRWV